MLIEKNERYTIWLIIVLTMTSTLSLHIITPIIPAFEHIFETNSTYVQFSITIYLIGLVVGQVFFGDISEKLGRKPALLFGLLIYITGIILVFFSSSILFFNFSRFIQAFGASSCLVIGRAMIREISNDNQASRRLSILSAVMSLTPALSPFIGSYIYVFFGWKMIFYAILIILIILTILAYKKLPETLVLQQVKNKNFLKNKYFIIFVLVGSINSTSIYGLLTAVPFIFTNKFQISFDKIGSICLFVVLGVSLGSFISNLLIVKINNIKLITLGLIINIVSSISMIIFSYILMLDLYVFLLVLYSLGVGIVTPNAISLIMKEGINSASSASSIYGVIQMSLGVIITLIVSLLDNSTELALSLLFLIASTLNFLLLLWAKISTTEGTSA